MLNIVNFNSDFKASTYKFDGTRTEVNYDTAFQTLMQKQNISISALTDEIRTQLDSILQQVHLKASKDTDKLKRDELLHKVEEFIPTHVTELNPYIVEGFKQYVGWTSDNKGNVAFLIRTPSEGNTWDIVDDLIAYTTSHTIDSSYIIEHLSGYYYNSVNNGGVYLYRLVHPETGKWSKRYFTKVDLYKIASERAFKSDVISNDEYKLIQSKKDYFVKSNELESFKTVWSPNAEGTLYNSWRKTSNASMPMPVTLTNDATEPAFSYINLEGLYDGDTPDFDGWLEMMPEILRESFMAVLYACVDAKAHLPVLTWLHGQGSEAKSEFFRALSRAFGQSILGATSAKACSSEFGLENLVGKRIIMIGDLQNGNFLHTNVAHGITGRDLMPVNRKNQKQISYQFNSMIFVGANTPPEVNMDARNEARRLFYIELSEPSVETMRKYCVYDEETGTIERYANGMPKFKGYDLAGKMVEEMPHILYKCKQAFDKLVPTPYTNIVFPPEVFQYMYDRCGSDEVDVYDKFAMDVVKEDKNATTPAIEVTNAYLSYVHGQSAIGKGSKYPFEITALKRYLKIHFGATIVQKTINGKRLRVYEGIKLNLENLTNMSIFSDDSRPEPINPTVPSLF